MPTDTSEGQTSIAVIGAIIGAAATGVPAMGVWLLNLLRTRRELAKQQRTDAITEWQEIVGMLQKDLATIKSELEDCREQHTQAQKKMGELNGELLALRTLMNKKRTGVHQKPSDPEIQV